MVPNMQARNIIQSYNLPSLLRSYVYGTRDWLFDKVNHWLDSAIQASGVEAKIQSRMFLLLAGPGMVRSRCRLDRKEACPDLASVSV